MAKEVGDVFERFLIDSEKPVDVCYVEDKLLVADKRSVRLYDSKDCNYIQTLWEVPSEDKEPLVALSSCDDKLCVCVTKLGLIYVWKIKI